MLLVVGELINSTRKQVREAIALRDEPQIRDLARRQVAAGADVLDLNAGESDEQELADLLWLIDVVEDELGPATRLAIDTSDPEVMADAIGACSSVPFMNSISNEANRLPLFEVAKGCDCEMIGLAMGDSGVPMTADARVREASMLIEKCASHGISERRLYIDLICITVAVAPEQGLELLEAIRRVRSELDAAPLVAVSNISFGLPSRRLLNRTYLAMLVAAGLAGAILDPTDYRMADAIRAARALTGQDKYCVDFNRHHREQASARRTEATPPH